MNIEKEVQRLMDIEAIKDLKNRYARMCNDNHNYSLVDTIFAPNVKWEGSPDDPWGCAEGRDAFIELFKGFQKQMDGRCLGQGYYDDDYVKIDGKWYIETLRFKDTLVADPATGWKDELIQEF